MSGEERPRVQPAVPPPRKPDEGDRTTVLAIATVGLFPLLWFMAPVALVLAHTEIRDLRARGRAAPMSLRVARALGIIGTTLLGFAILCWAGHLAPLS